VNPAMSRRIDGASASDLVSVPTSSLGLPLNQNEFVLQEFVTLTRELVELLPNLTLEELSASAITKVLHQSITTPIPLSARLPLNYRKLPTWMRNAVARHAVRNWDAEGHTHRAPIWPVDTSLDFFADQLSPTPDYLRNRTPVIISHDLDTREGLNNYLEFFLPMELRLGVSRPAAFIVPKWFQHDDAAIPKLIASTELGIHGYDHSGRTPFAESAELSQRLKYGANLAARLGASGYRAPSLLRSANLLLELEATYSFDSSIPTSGGPLPTPGSGAATVRPFLINSLVEVPVTLPRDGSLIFLGNQWFDIGRIWRESAQIVRGARGVVVLLIHCENRFSGSPQGRQQVESFVSWLAANDDYYFSTFEEVVHSSRKWYATPRIQI
jgi:hypothetical protein